MIGHRGEPIQELLETLEVGLRVVFQTERKVIVSTSSATGLMEAGLRNGVAGGRVLSLVNGAFSDRFSEISLGCGYETEIWEVEWGLYHEPAELAERLAIDRYDAVTLSHSETSTGALQDLEGIARVVGEHKHTMLLVDSVTGIGGVRVPTDEWAVDFILTGSQKALALPPGLAFGVASPALMDRSGEATAKGFYFDLLPLTAHLDRFETPATPAVSLLYALEVQLERILTEGMEARWARHLAMQEMTFDWVRQMQDKGVDVDVLAPEGHRSPTVTCVQTPGGDGGTVVVGQLRDKGFVVGTGYGKLQDSTIRIGHMGDHTVVELADLLEALTDVLL
jgi:aspartate aminotransferase-like enzyme